MLLTVIGWSLFAVAALAALALYLDRDEVREQLKWARERAENWEKEAKALGWKSPFDEITESLNNSVDQLNKTAEVLKRTCALQRETTAKWKKLAETCREIAAGMRVQNEALAAAKQKLGSGVRPRVTDPKPEIASPAAKATHTIGKDDVVTGSVGWVIPPELPN